MSGAESEKEREHLQPYEHRPYLTSSLVMFDSEEEEEEEEDEVPHFLPCLFEEDDRTDLWICDIVSWEDFCDIILRERLWRHHSLLSPLMGRAVSPASSCVSMKSGRSMRLPLSFKRPESMRPMQSDRPIEIPPPVKLSDPPSMRHHDFFNSPLKERAVSRASSSVSMKSDRSMDFPLSFKRPESMRSMQSDRPMEIPPPVKLSDPPSMEDLRDFLHRFERSLSSCDSAQSDHSMNYPMAF